MAKERQIDIFFDVLRSGRMMARLPKSLPAPRHYIRRLSSNFLCPRTIGVGRWKKQGGCPVVPYLKRPFSARAA